jgi:hypothetical protein
MLKNSRQMKNSNGVQSGGPETTRQPAGRLLLTDHFSMVMILICSIKIINGVSFT